MPWDILWLLGYFAKTTWCHVKTLSRQVASASVGQVYRATMSGREAPDCVPRVDIHLEGSLRKEMLWHEGSHVFKSSNSFASSIIFLIFLDLHGKDCERHNLQDRRFFVVLAFADLDAIWLFCYASLQLAFWGRSEGPTPWRAGTGHPGPVRGAANCQHRCHIFD